MMPDRFTGSVSATAEATSRRIRNNFDFPTTIIYLPLAGAGSPNQYAAVTPPTFRKSLPVMNAPSAVLL
jgi:hypothetical protein